MRFKKAYIVDLSRTGSEGFLIEILIERPVLDLLSIRDPDGISQFEREGDIGLGDPFSFPFQIPFQTIESIIPLEDGRLLLLNDNNYPLSVVRNPDEPDDTEAITIRLDALLNSPPIRQMPGTSGP